MARGWSRRMRGWRSSGTRRARFVAPTISRASRRSVSAARRCRASRRSRISCCGPARAAPQSGTEIRVNGGAVASVTEVGMPEGTSIEVADLFYNLPARRKFLKSDGAESAQVSRIVTQLALVLSGDWLHADQRRAQGAAVPAGGRRCAIACISCTASATT